jgi:hypothetical protein
MTKNFSLFKNFLTFYKNCNVTTFFNPVSTLKILFFKRYINRFSLQLIISPKKNNTICTIIPYYNQKFKSKFYHKSAGSFSKTKGYIRRSRKTKKSLYEEAAFTLIRNFKKKSFRYKFIVFKLYKFYSSIRKKYKENTTNYIETNFFKFFKKQVYMRFPIIKFEFFKSHTPYGGNKICFKKNVRFVTLPPIQTFSKSIFKVQIPSYLILYTENRHL